MGIAAFVGVLAGGIGIGLIWGTLGGQSDSSPSSKTTSAQVAGETYEERYGEAPQPSIGAKRHTGSRMPEIPRPSAVSPEPVVEDKSLPENYREDYIKRRSGIYIPGMSFPNLPESNPGRRSSTPPPLDGAPFDESCADGDVRPWTVLYGGATRGGITVGAPCRDIAEQEVLDQLPDGTFVVDSWPS